MPTFPYFVDGLFNLLDLIELLVNMAQPSGVVMLAKLGALETQAAPPSALPGQPASPEQLAAPSCVIFAPTNALSSRFPARQEFPSFPYAFLVFTHVIGGHAFQYQSNKNVFLKKVRISSTNVAAILCSGATIHPPCFHVETEEKEDPFLESPETSRVHFMTLHNSLFIFAVFLIFIPFTTFVKTSFAVRRSEFILNLKVSASTVTGVLSLSKTRKLSKDLLP